MGTYIQAAGITCNEAEQLKRARLKTAPQSKAIIKPTFPFANDQRPNYPERYGWNPVYWSDYPKQPMWTVPMPKIAAPTATRALADLPELPCHCPPTEYFTSKAWIPDIPMWSCKFNPYVDERNIPFKHLLGPPTLPPAAMVDRMHCN